jgi:hypothetical protein
MNLYAYTGSNPVARTDPMGLAFTIKSIKIPGIPASHTYLDFGDGDIFSAHNPPGWPKPGPLTPFFGPYEDSKDSLIEAADDSNGPLGGTRTTQISCPAGTDMEAAKQCAKDAKDKLSKCGILYRPVLGPNSNTATYAVFKKCLGDKGCKLVGRDKDVYPQPNTAPGAPAVGWPPIDNDRLKEIFDCIDGDGDCDD